MPATVPWVQAGRLGASWAELRAAPHSEARRPRGLLAEVSWPLALGSPHPLPPMEVRMSRQMGSIDAASRQLDGVARRAPTMLAAGGEGRASRHEGLRRLGEGSLLEARDARGRRNHGSSSSLVSMARHSTGHSMAGQRA